MVEYLFLVTEYQRISLIVLADRAPRSLRSSIGLKVSADVDDKLIHTRAEIIFNGGPAPISIPGRLFR